MGEQSSVFQHFRTEEHPFIERVDDWMNAVRGRHQPYLTDFLNPRERYILRTLGQRSAGVSCFFDGGYEHAEYARCLVTPDYWHPAQDEFELCFLKITGAGKFQSLDHRDYLGAMMHLGIKRETFGDLLAHGDTCQLVTTAEMGDFIRTNLKQVHRVHVSVEEIGRERLIVGKPRWREQNVTVASARLDAVLSAAYPLSRSKTAPLIRSGKCKVNWKIEENPAAPVEPGDTLSLRGYGRVQVMAIEGLTKRGRIRMTLGKPL